MRRRAWLRWRVAPTMRSRRIILRIVLALVAVQLAVSATMLLYRRVQNRDSELSQAEWRNLRERFFRRAAVVEEVDASAGPAPPEPAAPTPTPTPTPRRRPARPDRDPELLVRQAAEYAASRPKSVVELQPFRLTQSIEALGPAERRGTATLINLNPEINRWYLLQLRWSDGAEADYHLVNTDPDSQDLTLDPANPSGVTLVSTLGAVPCDLWSAQAPGPLDLAARAKSPYVTLCDDGLTIRIRKPGHRTTLEWATDVLRDNVRGGERITVFVREKFFQDAYLSTAELADATEQRRRPAPAAADAPPPARLNPTVAEQLLVPGELGISLEGGPDRELLVGRWYRARSDPGIYVSVIQPGLVEAEILRSHRDAVRALDAVESEALVYLIAFDLERFEVGFALGTEHPRVGWSDRAPAAVRDPALPGPDGIAEIAPLVATGIIPRAVADRAAATFTGGFKRAHGAFRVSDLAHRNRASHYGFVESGVILSKLHPGLATIYALDDGRLEMKTWKAEDHALLPSLRFARQNGVPIVDFDPETGSSAPGALVGNWVAGNWSGSQDQKLRTVRAGGALVETGEKRFLLYAYFSSATPSAMARVFQAYATKYAMLLDMNALEHTYLAVYRASGEGLVVEHLVEGMKVLDREVDGQTLPRFLGYADNRDFFYLLKEPGPAAAAGKRGADGGP